MILLRKEVVRLHINDSALAELCIWECEVDRYFVPFDVMKFIKLRDLEGIPTAIIGQPDPGGSHEIGDLTTGGLTISRGETQGFRGLFRENGIPREGDTPTPCLPLRPPEVIEPVSLQYTPDTLLVIRLICFLVNRKYYRVTNGLMMWCRDLS